MTAGSDAGDTPPLEESPDADSVKVPNSIIDYLSGDFVGVGGDVVVRRQRHATRIAEGDGEMAGRAVEGVGLDVGREKADWEAVLHQFIVCGGAALRRDEEDEERESEEREN